MRYVFSLLLSILIATQALAIEIWTLEQRTPFNVKIQQSQPVDYRPLQHAKRAWRLCVLVPHLKDAYWIGINYGLVTHATALNINLDLFEAGSYYHTDKQLEQLAHCMQGDYDGILLGAVTPNLLNKLDYPITKPVLALVNQLNNPQVDTHIGVNWYQMGLLAGQFIQQDANSQKATLALLAGPENLGGTELVEQGIRHALEGTHVSISAIQHADNNRNLYRDQLQVLLNAQQPHYILGSAVAIEAAISSLNQKQLSQRIKLVSSYLSPAILRGLQRHKVHYSNDDFVVLQGKLAIDVLVRQLETPAGSPLPPHIRGDIGPAIMGRTPAVSQALPSLELALSLAAPQFYPLYRVRAHALTPQTNATK